ncbi:hypothetical protein KRE40_12580 [Elizabethkingia meningoseptica]|uniref:Uncharacterized protein n=1 Tax=Elizabethkingia meningoseptica TaxID=238 RepID=A0A1V3U687_ELIME|nr:MULTISPECIES: hypothetical protein [Elizabethkingia]AQX03936.1 hypothetical protein BBD33_01115 [Elizabethkingia meningoseptica]AQX11399.1 hypothetical protein BBD35_02930 [Elizabethkingia meningoseptica]AQX45976.1 hypothetical protein B5G46_01115 [Elizabethkingia meningoseptica]EJK5329261.1 hypothetical protein [Elizabethkingia meningoseptica]KUY15268.1 hypothetical protein ATB99_12310 [Elizabethkingia meningoseptica]
MKGITAFEHLKNIERVRKLEDKELEEKLQFLYIRYEKAIARLINSNTIYKRSLLKISGR